MTKGKRRASDTSELRRRAVNVLHTRDRTAPDVSTFSPDRYRQELEIHRVELELQNEELRNARAELEAGLDRYTQLFDFAPIGYATLTREGAILEMNHVGAGIVFESRARLIGKPFANLISPAERPSFAELLDIVGNSDQKEVRDYELIKIGAERPSVRITAVSLARVEPTILLAFEDITAHKQAEERLLRADAALRQADRRKDEFLAVLSHELRTPLSTLLMYGQLLRQGGLDEDKVQAAAEAIERAARVQARLIDDLLDVSRIVAGKLSMQVEEVNVVVVVRAAVDGVSREAERRGLALALAFDSEVPPIVGDSGRLRQVVTNLLTNAIKFTPPSGHINVAVRRKEGCVYIRVEDTGAGIDCDFLPHIFERFSQADRTMTRTAGGLGLGLSIARSIVEAHHGSIRARSAGRGKGSSFEISLPIGISPRLAVVAPAARPPVIGGSPITGKRLLVVEDDESTRETLTDVLSFAGADVRAAAGGAAAMRVLEEFQPHVLVCDIGMPDEDGCTLLRRIRKLGRPASDIRALALTAFAGDEDRARTRAAGFETHLVKPVDIDQLIAAVTNLLRHSEDQENSTMN